MENTLRVFENAEFGKIRTVEIDGEPWLVGKDVAMALGYKDTNQALRQHVDSEDKLTRNFNGSGQSREMFVINESGLYTLILGSKLPSAKRFKHWVTSEVLPSIRKTGAYQIKEAPPAHPLRLTALVNDIDNTARKLETLYGKAKNEALATATDMAGKMYEVDVTPLKKLLPITEQLEDMAGLYSPLDIAIACHIHYMNGNPDPRTVNRILWGENFQRKAADGWRLTEKGRIYGVEFLRPHKAPIIRWRESIFEAVEDFAYRDN